jgi:glutamyl-Q tRNA(Asp) synthetase
VSYVGRFAPSPTGPLHLGSLVTAVASFLNARQANGEWLVRIEDIDPPREMPGAADQILRTLEAFELEWDRDVWRQSTRISTYRAAAERLVQGGLAFRCSCTRSSIRAANEAYPTRYPGTCRDQHLTDPETAVRVRVDPGTITFADGLQGAVETDLHATTGDYVIVRRDGLPAYHLAVVIDDAAQRVTNIVRGVDLLDSTAAHIHLQRALGVSTPDYWHLPVVVNADGQKLSKQTGAAAVETTHDAAAATVLRLLGAEVPADLVGERPRVLWQWALRNWDIHELRGQRALAEVDVPGGAPPGQR